MIAHPVTYNRSIAATMRYYTVDGDELTVDETRPAARWCRRTSLACKEMGGVSFSIVSITFLVGLALIVIALLGGG